MLTREKKDTTRCYLIDNHLNSAKDLTKQVVWSLVVVLAASSKNQYQNLLPVVVSFTIVILTHPQIEKFVDTMTTMKSLFLSSSLVVALLLMVATTANGQEVEVDGDKRLILFTGPHHADALEVDTFFARNRFAPAMREWLWPVEFGPLAHSLQVHGKRDMFRHLVLEANNQSLMEEMYSSIAEQWSRPAKKKGMIIGTEEFDRVGTVPYSQLDGKAAMARIIDTVNMTDNMEDITVVVNYRAPRIDQWLSVFEYEVRGRDHYKGFVCSRNQDSDDYDMLWETLDTAMNPLFMVTEYRKRGWNVVLIDTSGVDKAQRNIAHVIACDILKVNCTGPKHPPGWVDDISNATYTIEPNDREFLSVSEDHQAELERLFRRRDCTFQKEIEEDDGVTILLRETLWHDCIFEDIHDDMIPHLRDTTAIYSAIRSQKDCETGLTMDELLEEDSFIKAGYEKLEKLLIIFIILIGACFILNIISYKKKSNYLEKEAKNMEARDRLQKAFELKPNDGEEERTGVMG